MNPGVGELVQECSHGMSIGTVGVAAIACRGRGQDCVEMLLASARPVRVPVGRVTMSPVCLSGPADETRRDSESN